MSSEKTEDSMSCEQPEQAGLEDQSIAEIGSDQEVSDARKEDVDSKLTVTGEDDEASAPESVVLDNNETVVSPSCVALCSGIIEVGEENQFVFGNTTRGSYLMDMQNADQCTSLDESTSDLSSVGTSIMSATRSEPLSTTESANTVVVANGYNSPMDRNDNHCQPSLTGSTSVTTTSAGISRTNVVTSQSSDVIRYPTTTTAAFSLVAEYRSDKSESMKSSSDSESTSSVDKSVRVIEIHEVSDDEEKAKNFRPRTKGELFVDDLPPIEDLCITVNAETPLMPLGKVSSIVANLVVVQSEPNSAPLDMDSVIFTEDRKSLGQIFETFGPVKSPFYSIRFNTVEQMNEKGVEVGMMLYFVPSVPDYTHFVFMTDLLKSKGSDASWENNNEPPTRFLDYSDDEQERLAKGKKNRKRDAKGLDASWENNNEPPTRLLHYSDDELERLLKVKKNRRRGKGEKNGQHWPPEDEDSDTPDGCAGRREKRPPKASRGRGPRLPNPRYRGPQPVNDGGTGQHRPRPPVARFGAPPMFPLQYARPMYGMPPLAPPRFVLPGRFESIPAVRNEPPQHAGAHVRWPRWAAPHWPSGPGHIWPPGSAPNAGPPPPPPSVPSGATHYSSQAEYWAQYGK